MDSGFIGTHHDDDVGLIDLRGRVYDPAIRRFLTPDPVVGLPLFGQSYNRYSYSLNNPINFSDPGGLDPGPVGCGEKNDCLSVKAPYLGPEPRMLKKSGGLGGGKSKPANTALPTPKTIAADP